MAGTRTQESYYIGGTSGTRVDTNSTYSPAGEVLTMSNTLTGSNYNSGALISNMQNSAFGPSSFTFGNGLNGVKTYDSLGRPSGTFVCSGSTSIYCNNGSQLYGMTESVVGNRVTSLSDFVLGTGGTPSYDEFNRLSGMSYGARGQAFSYTYDRYGNRWNQTVTQGNGPSPQLSFSSTTNQVTTNTYDAAGNVMSDGTYSYTYDAEGNVTAVNGGSTATYVYDAYNHRVRQTTSSADVAYTFNTDGQRVAQWSESGTSPSLLASYTYWNGVPLATYITSNQAVYYSHQDLLGTKRMTTTANSLEYGGYQSLPFGDGYSVVGSDPDASQFGLLDSDSETGSDHAQYRQLSITQGRWFSPDPYNGSYSYGNPQSLNRYEYVLNNPLTLVDPSGQVPDCSSAQSNPQAVAQCYQALASMPNCAMTISAACSTAPPTPTETDEQAIANYESYSLHQGDRAETTYVNGVNKQYWSDIANIMGGYNDSNEETNPFMSWPLNGDLLPFTHEQDQKCSAGSWLGPIMDANAGMYSACQWHDNEYINYQCNWTSWIPVVPGSCKVINAILVVRLAAALF